MPISDDANCTDAVERLYHFLDGELDGTRRAVVQRHLDECLPCLEAFDFEVELRQVVASRCRERPPDGLMVRIALAIQSDVGPEEGSGEGIPRP